MHDIFSILDGLKRPRLLVRAARAGCDAYRREAHLYRHLGPGKLPKHGAAVLRLIDKESALNVARTQKATGYSLVAHVDVLIALMAEARLLRMTQPQG
ncbi:hypothetical protein shim_09590 [Shimia sp. SK013]|uniref:DUF6477 family protein n=1 Tax=Shimia sp. SK013 TaxID=1389006 RepID=UPI0006B43458|nr:DUF6477 family protein [Shimia sp. SK013]KPA22672.1 hypothetical protein shim_09590 [Shimia sp. SK013]